MKAAPDAQRRLLDLQQLDSRADQIRHQLAHLPELEELKGLHAQRIDVDGLVQDAQMKVDDLTLEQKKVDRDVESVKSRRQRDQQRIDDGLVTSPKDLERMNHELESLERRISSLEDDELEVMQQLEDAQSELDGHRAHLEETMRRGRAAVAARDEKTAALQRELDGVETERKPLAAQVPEDLLALYDRLRADKGGLAAAELRARRCGGCMLDLDNAELEAIKARAEDDVVRCEECGRILVRTNESGL